MNYTYIDESGNTGTKGRYIIFASITTTDPRTVGKTMKKLWRAKPQFHAYGELHAKEVDDSTRKRVLLELAKLPITIRHKVLNKHRAKLPITEAYYLMLSHFIHTHDTPLGIIVVDKKDTNKKRSLVIKKLQLESSYKGVDFEESHRFKQLQAVDFIAWSLGRLYEYDDDSFYNLIRHKESPSL